MAFTRINMSSGPVSSGVFSYVHSLLLLLQDVMMPDVDGIELLRHVRGDDTLSAIPVVSKFLLACAHSYFNLTWKYWKCSDFARAGSN